MNDMTWATGARYSAFFRCIVVYGSQSLVLAVSRSYMGDVPNSIYTCKGTAQTSLDS